MKYFLATTEDKIRWYTFSTSSSIQHGDFVLTSELDVNFVPAFDSKETAKQAAKALGLKTWRYFRMD